MKLSQTDKSEFSKLSKEQTTKIVFGNYEDDGASADVALLLGGRPLYWEERSGAAAKLYLDGRVKYIIPSGGVEWDYEGERLSEAHGLTRLLKEKGVPEEAIIIENEATTTMENMVYGTLQMCRRMGGDGRFFNVKSVIVVSSGWHLRRSLIWAKNLLPRSVKVSGYAADALSGGAPDNWHESEWFVDRVNMEVDLLKDIVDSGLAEDIEY